MSLRRRTVEVLVAAGLSVTALAPPAAAAGEGGEGHGRAVPLRVATYNIHAGAGTDNVFDLDRQAAELRSLDADVIGLQEVDVHWGTRSEWRDLAGELAERLDMQVSFAPVYSLDPQTPGAPRREFGVAVLSRYRIVSAENHEITRLSTQVPNPVPAPAPGFGEVVVRVKGLPVHVYVTHLDYRADPSVRSAQVADTRRIMAEDQEPGTGRRPVRQILLGDLNAALGRSRARPAVDGAHRCRARWADVPGAGSGAADRLRGGVEGFRADTRRGGGRDSRLGPPPGCRRSAAAALSLSCSSSAGSGRRRWRCPP